jgi:hypothetical protein
MLRDLVLATTALFLILVNAGAAPAVGPRLYDNFGEKDKKLVSAKWSGDEIIDPGILSEEIQRAISGGKLLMAHRAVGDWLAAPAASGSSSATTRAPARSPRSSTT